MDTTIAPAPRWATAADWSKYQPIIMCMYIDQNKTLNSVMEAMKTEHGFYATKKMYKRRFTQWGAEKYLRTPDVLAILHQKAERDAVNKRSEFTVRGRKVDVDHLQRHLRRKWVGLRKSTETLEKADLTDRGIVCLTPPPEPKLQPTEVPRRIGNDVCLRCGILGLQCYTKDEGNVCCQCFELAKTQHENTVLAFSQCIRSSISDVNIFADRLPSVEFRHLTLRRARRLSVTKIALSFDVDWRLPSLVKGAASWLSQPEESNASRVGILCSNPFLELVKCTVGQGAAYSFQHMLRATSFARALSNIEGRQPYEQVCMLKDIGSLAGHDILSRLEQQLKPQNLAQGSKAWFEAHFLMVLGTMLSVGYTPRDHDSPAFPAVSDCMVQLPVLQTYTLWDARKEHLCRILSHYLILLSSKLGLNIALQTEKELLDSGISRWLRDGQYSWTLHHPVKVCSSGERPEQSTIPQHLSGSWPRNHQNNPVEPLQKAPSHNDAVMHDTEMTQFTCSLSQSRQWEQMRPMQASPGSEVKWTSCSSLKTNSIPKVEGDLWIPDSNMIRNQGADVGPVRSPGSSFSSTETLTPSHARDEALASALPNLGVAEYYSSACIDSRKGGSLELARDNAPQSAGGQPQKQSQASYGQATYPNTSAARTPASKDASSACPGKGHGGCPYFSALKALRNHLV